MRDITKGTEQLSFAEQLKSINRTALERKANPDIDRWKKDQREQIVYMFKKDALSTFEHVANCGLLVGYVYKEGRWGKQIENIPNAEVLTRQIVEEIFEPYGITVVLVEVKENGYITIHLTIQ